MISAEFGVHMALGWGQPASCIDPYVEFRHLTNDARVKSGDREKDFYSIGGALRHFRLNPIDIAHKKEMRNRILQGPPFSARERRDIFDYCTADTDALATLVPSIGVARANARQVHVVHSADGKPRHPDRYVMA
jgi:hypothetical protein